MKKTTLLGAAFPHPKRNFLLSPDAAEGAVIEKQEEKKEEVATEKKPDEKPLETFTPEELKAEQKKLKDFTRGHKPAKKEKVEEKKPEAKKEEPAKEEKKVEETKKAEPVAAAPSPAKKPAVETVKPTPVDVPPPIGNIQPDERKVVDEFQTTIELRPADHRKLQVIAQMEEDGGAPKGTAKKMLKFWEKEAAYIEKWSTEHPGQKFDDTADEHAGFYEQNEVTYDPESYEASRDALVRNEAKREMESGATKEKKREERIQQFKAAAGEIEGKVGESVMDMLEQAAPELAELMGKGKDRKLNADVEKAMIEKDPVITEILKETSEELAVLTRELHRLTEFDDIYQSNPAKTQRLEMSGRVIQPHGALLHFMTGLEQELLKQDPAKTMRGGKRLVSNHDFSTAANHIVNSDKPAAEKRASLADLEKKYWTLDESDFKRGLVADFAHRARTDIEKFTKRAGLRAPKPKVETAAAPAEAKKDEKTDEPSVVARTKSPSTATASDAVDTKTKSGGEMTDDAKTAVARSRGR